MADAAAWPHTHIVDGDQIPRPTPWRRAAVVLGVTTGFLLVVGSLYAFGLTVQFDSTSTSAYEAKVGSDLLHFIAMAASILVTGVVLSRPRVFGPNAHALATASAVIALGVLVGGQVHAYQQLHPSLTEERMALAEFIPPPGSVIAYTTTGVSATPDIRRGWDVTGTATTVCAAAEAAVDAWAALGTVHPPAQQASTHGCHFVASKGADDLMVDGYPELRQDRVYLALVLTRTR